MGRPKKQAAEPAAATSDGIQFFGDIDLTDDNRIRSPLPAWYQKAAIAELEENIGRKKRALKNRMIKEDLIMRTEAEIKAEEERLNEIVSSLPKLNSAQRDRCASSYKMLADQIRESMPTRKQTRDGLVSPQKEYQRLKVAKHIKIDPDIAAACGVRPQNGKITGTEAATCYKILGGALGEETNIEHLRRDGNSEAYQSMNDLTQAILRGQRIQGA